MKKASFKHLFPKSSLGKGTYLSSKLIVTSACAAMLCLTPVTAFGLNDASSDNDLPEVNRVTDEKEPREHRGVEAPKESVDRGDKVSKPGYIVSTLTPLGDFYLPEYNNFDLKTYIHKGEIVGVKENTSDGVRSFYFKGYHPDGSEVTKEDKEYNLTLIIATKNIRPKLDISHGDDMPVHKPGFVSGLQNELGSFYTVEANEKEHLTKDVNPGDLVGIFIPQDNQEQRYFYIQGYKPNGTEILGNKTRAGFVRILATEPAKNDYVTAKPSTPVDTTRPDSPIDTNIGDAKSTPADAATPATPADTATPATPADADSEPTKKVMVKFHTTDSPCISIAENQHMFKKLPESFIMTVKAGETITLPELNLPTYTAYWLDKTACDAQKRHFSLPEKEQFADTENYLNILRAHSLNEGDSFVVQENTDFYLDLQRKDVITDPVKVEPAVPATPVETAKPAEPTDTAKPAEPIDTAKPATPVDTTKPVTSGSTTSSVVINPVTTTAPATAAKPVKNGWSQGFLGWMYYNNNKPLRGWVLDKGSWYYMNTLGLMKTGWIFDKGSWYYTNNSGKMETGWMKLNDTWYHLDNSGAMTTGWIYENHKWYYLTNSGAMATGWFLDGDDWYYANGSGAMQTGWLQHNGLWYYLDNSGQMEDGWKKIDGTWYYFEDDGHMVTGSHNIDGITYRFDSSGALIG